MGRIKDENFYLIQGWMLNRLNLKGIDLQIFAIIYGFSQDDVTEFTGSIGYLSEFTGMSRPTVIKSLKKLCENRYIIKKENKINGVIFNTYKTLRGVKNFNWGSKETLLGGSKETLPNNNILNNNKYIKEEKENSQNDIIQIFNELCISLPKVKTITETRKKAAKSIVKKYSVEQIKEVFEKAEASDFLKGKNNRDWQANFDWLMKDSNFAKVLDGNYDNKKVGKGKVQGAAYDLELFEKMLNEDN